MYTLYWSPGAASLVVHLALRELGVPFALEKVDIASGAHKTEAYRQLNPAGVIPALAIAGKPHIETCALLLTLGDRHPEAKLAPTVEDPDRPAYVEWMVRISNGLQPPFRTWFYPADVIDDPAQHAAVKAKARATIEARFADMDAKLGARGPYVLGERFSLADLYTTMMMRWSRNMPKPATEWPNLKRLADLVRARPSWDALYEVEGLDEWRR